MTPHINSKKEDIAKIVLCPGDPLRAKYIAENFLQNSRLVNSVRNMLAYTGTYQGKEITIFSSGMGMPSMGIYCYETLNIFDTVLVEKSYTEGNFARALNNIDCHIIEADKTLNSLIKETALKNNLKCISANVLCGECFDRYVEDINILLNRLPKDSNKEIEYKSEIPKDFNITAAEMESFALFYTAKYLNKKAACLLTVVDNHYKKQEISADEREQSLNDMITIALESAIKLIQS